MMSYEIGPKAKAEFSAFSKKERAAAAEAELLPLPPVPLAPPATDPDKALPIEAPKIDPALLKNSQAAASAGRRQQSFCLSFNPANR